MLVIIIDENRLIKENISSNYIYKKIIINDSEISLSDDYFFSDGSRRKKLIFSNYEIFHKEKKILLFIYETYEENFCLYENKGFSFGKDIQDDIVSTDPYIKNDYIILKDNIIQTNSNYLFINGKRYNNKPLINGDLIEMFSFKCIYNQEFLYIDNYLSTININKYLLCEKKVKYEVINPAYNNFFIDTNNELKIDKIKELSLPHHTKQRNILLQLGSSMTMSLSMLFLAYINIQKNINTSSMLDIIAVLIMPLTMLLSSILWPIVSNLLEKKEYKKEYRKVKKEYIKYLYQYEKNCIDSINKYLIKEYDSFFYKDNILKKLFYIQKNSKDFVSISLGLYTKINNYQYIESEDEEINKYIENIYKKINNIDNHPLKINISKHKVITINTSNKRYFFKKYLLELVTKYHYNDLQIVIYDKNRSFYHNIYNLPHLFHDGQRLTFSNERELQILNCISKETIVLAFDKFSYKLNNNCHILYFTEKHELFNNSDCIIEYKKDYGVLNDETSILFDYSFEDIDFEQCFEQISYYYIPKFKKEMLSFNNFYNPNDIKNNYLAKQISLEAQFATSDGELISFDLHENKDGPHGLIGGSTGSGKSELIVSLLLSLCIKYRPDYLNIILIDYKGGGIANSLSFNNKVIPHIIGEITNLAEGSIERLIFALSSECKKREEAFKKMSSKLNISVTNIDEYIDLYDDNYSLPKISHLLIIVDEFAELKKSNPEIIKQLVSFSRIGRSLGIHLILSTQKPNGVIDDEIWSNSHFKIALKLNDEKDSQDIIKTKDAAYIKNPGEFILRVDNNLIKADALYSKKSFSTNKEIKVSLLDDQYNIKSTKTIRNKTNISEALFYSSLINDVVEKLKINVRKIEFEKPEQIDRKKIENKSFTMGIVDDYLNAKKYILNIPFSENILIYSTRDNEINSVINTLNENQIDSIIISHRFVKYGYIRDSILYDENEKIYYLFNNCQIEKYKMYLIIEDFNSFVAYDDNCVQFIYKLLKKSSSSNIKIIIFTKQNISNFKIINSFDQKLMIGISDQNELINFFGKKSRYVNDSYYMSSEPISFVPCLIEELIKIEPLRLPLIKEIPESILYKDMKDRIFIGFDIINRIEVFIYKNQCTLITCMNKLIYEKLALIFNSIHNIEVILYDQSLNTDKFQNVIWVGGGIFKQRMFISELKNDLNKNEAYYISGSKKGVFTIFDYEQYFNKIDSSKK